jgi:hypothetical protein
MLKLKFALLVPAIVLALSACGQLERERKTVAGVRASDPKTGDPELNKLASDCLSQGGRLAQAGQVCLTKIMKSLKAPEALAPADLDIDTAFTNGKFIVATAGNDSPANAVDILYNGRPLAKVPARMMADLKNLPSPGRLTFFVNTANYKDVNVTVWTCYYRNMQNRVFCSDKYIP